MTDGFIELPSGALVRLVDVSFVSGDPDSTGKHLNWVFGDERGRADYAAIIGGQAIGLGAIDATALRKAITQLSAPTSADSPASPAE